MSFPAWGGTVVRWLKSPLYIGICLAGFFFEFFIELPFRIAVGLDQYRRHKKNFPH